MRDKYGRAIGTVERQLSPFEQGQQMGEQAAGCAVIIFLLLPLFNALKGPFVLLLTILMTAFILIVSPPFAFALCAALTYIPVIGPIIGIVGFLFFAYSALLYVGVVLLQFTNEIPFLFKRNAKWHPFSAKEWGVGVWLLCFLGAGAFGFAVGTLIQLGFINGGRFL
ncbi:MAG: hypothetical protein HY741_29350 [Chloroflexi bacterium]|nr:hypothetical protein [Chloroflexota bacterium]